MTDKEKLEELEKNMHNAIEEYEDYQEEMLQKYCEGHNVEDLTIGDWKCDNSPLGVCVYDDCEDRCHDNCIFCGEPNERK